jgi:hypothetical protein
LAWWHTYVVPKQSPNDDPPALDVLKRLRREPASVIDLPATAADVLSVWEQTKDAAKQTKEEAEFAQAAALMLLDRHEAGRLPDGRLLTYLEQNTARQCDMDRLRTEFPDAYAQCSTQPKCRVLRIKKARK